MVIGEGFLAREYINAMYDMLTAYDFLLEDAFSTPQFPAFEGTEWE